MPAKAIVNSTTLLPTKAKSTKPRYGFGRTLAEGEAITTAKLASCVPGGGRTVRVSTDNPNLSAPLTQLVPLQAA